MDDKISHLKEHFIFAEVRTPKYIQDLDVMVLSDRTGMIEFSDFFFLEKQKAF